MASQNILIDGSHDWQYRPCCMPATAIRRLDLDLNVLETGGMVAALAWGNESSPARILCLHGWMDNAASTASRYLGFR
jgi:hypothetical protein